MTKASSRLGKQLEEAITTLDGVGARFALIGGLALAPHKVIRATQDVDLLIDADLANSVDHALTALGYKCLHRSADAANYLRGDQRLDFLYAHRPAARQLLQAAPQLKTPFGTVNAPRRRQDLEDIRALIRANRNTLNLAEVREYFRLFNQESLLASRRNAMPHMARAGVLPGHWRI